MSCCKSVTTKEDPRRKKENIDTVKKDPGKKKNASDVSPPARPIDEMRVFFRCTVGKAEEFIRSLSKSPETKEAVGFTFLNSLFFFSNKKWHCSGVECSNILQEVFSEMELPEDQSIFKPLFSFVSSDYVDDGFNRLLSVWDSQNPKREKSITVKVLQSILEMLAIYLNAVEVLNDRSIFEGGSTSKGRAKEELMLSDRGSVKMLSEDAEQRLGGSFPPLMQDKNQEKGMNVFSLESKVTFYQVLWFHFRWISRNMAAMEVFREFSKKDVMTVSEFSSFLRKTQYVDITDRQIDEKLKYRYGGRIHAYNFACFNGSVMTNPAIDQTRTLNVSQDMTQPLTHYIIGCARVDSPRNLEGAINRTSIRAFLLPTLTRCPFATKGKDNNDPAPPTTATTTTATILTSSSQFLVNSLEGDHSGSPLLDCDFLCGSCSLREIIKEIKLRGFEKNTYPIILCLPPSETIPYEDQVLLGRMLEGGFGDTLAKGLMLDACLIDDPKFTPSALRSKVLLMGDQGPLKPFLGILVADMNRGGIGVRVTDVQEGGPGAKGGIFSGDWLTHFNKKPISNMKTLKELLQTSEVGSSVIIRRENLYDAKVILGGLADEPTSDLSLNSPNTSDPDKMISCNSSSKVRLAKELSNWIFLKYTPPGENLTNLKPWDTRVIPTDDLLRLSSSLSERRVGDKWSQASKKSSPVSSVLSNDPDSHFSIAHIDDDSANPERTQSLLSAATRCGVQFIDVDNSDRCLSWSRGRFMDNGGCGYLLQPKLFGDPSGLSSSLRLIKKIYIEVRAGPRVIGNPPLKYMTAELFGEGEVKVDKCVLEFINCTESSICSARLVFEGPKGHGENPEEEENPINVFTASFSPRLCCLGFRALPCEPVKKMVNTWEGGGYHGTYVLVRHNKTIPPRK